MQMFWHSVHTFASKTSQTGIDAQFQARVNVHLLGLFPQTANSRWDLAVSPHIYAVTTKADIQTIADDAKVMKGKLNPNLTPLSQTKLFLCRCSGIPSLRSPVRRVKPEKPCQDGQIWGKSEYQSPWVVPSNS